MADYGCYPTWVESAQGVENVSPGDLPLSVELVASLLEWASRYDRTLHPDDPISSGFESSEEEGTFARDGFDLAKKVADELSKIWRISYYDLLSNSLRRVR